MGKGKVQKGQARLRKIANKAGRQDRRQQRRAQSLKAATEQKAAGSASTKVEG